MAKQPLLVVNRRSGDSIYLPTEICFEASLPEHFTRDFRAMQEIQPYKISSATKRLDKIMNLVRNFQRNECFSEWGITMEQEPIKV